MLPSLFGSIRRVRLENSGCNRQLDIVLRGRVLSESDQLSSGDTRVVFVFVGQNHAGFKQQATKYLSDRFQRLAASEVHA